MDRKRRRRLTPQEGEEIRHLYCDEWYSVDMISKDMGIDPSTPYRWLKKYGLSRNYSESAMIAREQGRRKWRSGAYNGFWKGGKHVTRQGYIRILITPDDPLYSMATKSNYVLEHRYVVAQHVGRVLSNTEIVHHLNGVKADNRLHNLVLVAKNNHPTDNVRKLLQKRIRELEGQLSQREFPQA